MAEVPPEGYLCRPTETRRPQEWPGRLPLTPIVGLGTLLDELYVMETEAPVFIKSVLGFIIQ